MATTPTTTTNKDIILITNDDDQNNNANNAENDSGNDTPSVARPSNPIALPSLEVTSRYSTLAFSTHISYWRWCWCVLVTASYAFGFNNKQFSDVELKIVVGKQQVSMLVWHHDSKNTWE